MSLRELVLRKRICLIENEPMPKRNRWQAEASRPTEVGLEFSIVRLRKYGERIEIDRSGEHSINPEWGYTRYDMLKRRPILESSSKIVGRDN